MRYAYAITAAMLLGGAAATITLQDPLGAQVAQNAPSQMAAVAPRGAPMSFADLAAKLQPAVVNISTTQKVQQRQQQNPFAGTPFEQFFGGPGGGNGGGQPATRDAVSLGSGFVISANGYIVTNNHVISGVPTEQGKVTISSITVTLPDRKEYKATVVGKDAASDLAVLKIEATNLPFVEFGDSTKTRVGDWVLAIGNPFALGGTVTAGIVSAIHRNIGGGPFDRYIQTDAAINQGNSGGPMFDLNGNVVGINSAIFSPTGGNVGIGFAIPAEQAKPIVAALVKGQTISRGYLGVIIQPMTDDIADSLKLPKNNGEIVARVEPGQPAAKAGIQQGDVIVRVNNTDVTPDNTLSFIVAGLPVGARVPIDLIRDGRKISAVAIVGKRPPEDQLALGGDDSDDGIPDDQEQTPQSVKNGLGISVQTLTPAIARQIGINPPVPGVVVTNVDPSSDAGSKGLQPKDVIVAIGSRHVSTAAEAATALDAAKKTGTRTVLLLVQRKNQPARYIGVDLTGK